tara:strand:+ start:263 stop:475 length:213 start_codon:yes stop_codon:yes gene_type:complete
MSDMKVVAVQYMNYRGEDRLRSITPLRLYEGATEHHPEHQWLMVAWDHDKLAERTFALKDCNFRVLAINK